MEMGPDMERRKGGFGDGDRLDRFCVSLKLVSLMLYIRREHEGKKKGKSSATWLNIGFFYFSGFQFWNGGDGVGVRERGKMRDAHHIVTVCRGVQASFNKRCNLDH
ncbi:hypothetical protein Ahy_A06g030503 isoform D [Arachis hypogaea]|uniref:Uncharacterized protein n=1 Tax=Arachis hypogaea TaxID=3818 RepID=A0A445CWE1_ARAHY|nr:hypothetical protein Ahy_A06g030503 isoform D [Arachis hypogaea]